MRLGGFGPADVVLRGEVVWEENVRREEMVVGIRVDNWKLHWLALLLLFFF